MATKEYIEKRIEGKEKEIAKLEKKLARIEKAKSTNWEVNPYWYDERELKSTVRDLDATKKSLEDYKTDLRVAGEKENSRNVLAITEFLQRWYDRNVEFYTEQKEKYQEALKVYYQQDKEHCDWYNRERRHLPREERDAIDNKYRKVRSKFIADWNHVTQYDRGSLSWEETMRKDLKAEAGRKYDMIIERTNEIVGTITDATGLTIGNTGELNGYIVGTNGTAKVQTIGAGGYNIQCFHFRTLITPIK